MAMKKAEAEAKGIVKEAPKEFVGGETIDTLL